MLRGGAGGGFGGEEGVVSVPIACTALDVALASWPGVFGGGQNSSDGGLVGVVVVRGCLPYGLWLGERVEGCGGWRPWPVYVRGKVLRMFASEVSARKAAGRAQPFTSPGIPNHSMTWRSTAAMAEAYDATTTSQAAALT